MHTFPLFLILEVKRPVSLAMTQIPRSHHAFLVSGVWRGPGQQATLPHIDPATLSVLRQPGNSEPVLVILLIIKTLAMRHVALEIISPMGFILL